MTELELYKWIQEHEPEWRWDINKSEEDVVIWVSTYALESFMKLLPSGLFDEGGIEVRLVDRYIAIWASDICDYCGIEMGNVFSKK